MKTLSAGSRRPVFPLGPKPIAAVLCVSCLFGMLILLPVASATTLPSTISETTTLTAANNPYEGGSVTISKGATLHIEPGVVVRLSSSLGVEGTLDASGTKGSPVVLTSTSDSAPKQWLGVVFLSGSGASTMSHVELRYARTGIRIWGASPSITDSWIHDNSESGIEVEGGTAEIDDNKISSNGYTAVTYTFPAEHPGAVDFDGNLVEANEGAGVSVWAPSATTKIESASLGENSFVENAGKAVSYDAYATTVPEYHSNPIPPNITTNTLSGNDENGIWLRGKVEQSTTWEDNGYALVELSEAPIIDNGATLTLGPGLVLKNGSLRVGGTESGTLLAEGTTEDPVIFTGLKDDSAAGDTNGDGSFTSPAPGEWADIHFAANGSGILEHAILRYGGFSGYSGDYAELAIRCPCEENVTIADTTIRKSLHAGVVMEDSDAQILGSSISENAETGLIATGGWPQIEGNTIAGNGFSVGSYSGVSLSFLSEHPGSVDFNENLVAGNNGDGISVSAPTAYTKIESASLGENAFIENAGKAVYYDAYATAVPEYHSNPIPPNITTNTLSGNDEDGIWLRGAVKQSTTWEDNGYALVSMTEGVIVAEEKTLALGPGLVIKNDGPGGGMTVVGMLFSEGEEGTAVTFTSLNDDSVAGDTNGDEGATEPAIADWSGISFPNANEASLSYLDIRYADIAVNVAYLFSDMEIRRSDFSYNKAAIEVEGTGSSYPGLAALPCVPPWLSVVFAVEDWFGVDGYPAPSLDIVNVVGNIKSIPSEYRSAFKYLASAGEVSAPLYLSDNTIPFKIYSCAPLAIPAIPVSPVALVDSPPLLTGPWFESPEAVWP